MSRWWISGLALLALPLLADEEKGAKATVRLVAGATAAVPGSSLELGLTFKIAPHWHIYWKTSGDSGVPPQIELSLPPELEQTGPVRWPRPARLVLPGDLINHAYEGEVTLVVPVRVKPDAVADGKPLKIGAKCGWLVCDADACIAEEGTAEVQLPVAKTCAPSPDAPALTRAAATLPRPPTKDEVQLAWSKTTLRLKVEGARGLTFFPDEPVDQPPPLTTTRSEGSELSLTYPEGARGQRITGHLVVALEGRTLDLWIETTNEGDVR